MHTSEEVPERDYRLEIIEYTGPRAQRDDDDPDDYKWENEYIKVAIVDEKVESKKSPNFGQTCDKEVKGRRNKIYLGNELRGHNFGYRDISMALQLDGDKGVPPEEWVGLKFDGSWFKKDGYDNIKPVIDYDWVSTEEDTSRSSGGRSKKKSSSRAASKSQSAEARRQRRRSR
jgi:hypothetical protein